MEDIVQKILEAPIPTILVIVGVLFLVLSVADKVSSHLVVPEERKKKALVLGLLLLGAGLVLHYEPEWLRSGPEAAEPLATSASPDFETVSWSSMTAEQRDHWAALGWTAESWEDNDLAPASNDKSFDTLSPEEQSAVRGLGFTPERWDVSR